MNLRNGLIMLVIILAVAGAVWMGGSKGETSDEAPVKGPEESTAKSEEAPSSPPQDSSAVEKPQQGFRAPNFKLRTLDGKTVELAKNGGKPSFINLWASWCPPCKMEMPHIQEAYEKYGDRVNFLMVNLTETDDLDKMKEYLSTEGFTFPVLLDEKGEVADRYGVMSIPMTYAVNEEGVIIHKQMGAMSREQIFDLMEQLVKDR